MNSFEYRIKLLRGRVTQQEFANQIGITKQKVSNYENGIVKPTYEVFKLLVTKLNVNLNWLITGKGERYIEMEFDESSGYSKVADKQVPYTVNKKK